MSIQYTTISCAVLLSAISLSALHHQSPECSDKADYKYKQVACAALAESGACNRYAFVRNNCAVSCGLCHPEPEANATLIPAGNGTSEGKDESSLEDSSDGEATVSEQLMTPAPGVVTVVQTTAMPATVAGAMDDLERELYSPKDIFIQRVIRQNAKARACCENEGMSKRCSKTCDFSTTAPRLVNAGMDCVADLGTLIKCVANGNDNTDCCALYSVPRLCHKLCKSNFNGPIDITLLMCLPYTGTVLACHQVRYPSKYFVYCPLQNIGNHYLRNNSSRLMLTHTNPQCSIF